ncbi:P-loop NTPase family protein, partial [Staphylococcus epidermidis]
NKNQIIPNLTQQQYTKLKTYNHLKQINPQNLHLQSIQINFPSNKFNLPFTFQHTPPLHSNLPTHHSTTHQFIYTTNFLFYTLHYNHLQSPFNFKFIKPINQLRIPIIFLINHIHKHNEEE